MKSILLLVITIAFLSSLYFLFIKGDTYIGFYYPDKTNLTMDIQSPITFDSLDDCRDWVDQQIMKYNPEGTNFDYECGKNCDLSGMKPYICEETLR